MDKLPLLTATVTSVISGGRPTHPAAFDVIQLPPYCDKVVEQ